MSASPWYCHLCAERPTFSKKFNLTRHLESKHRNSSTFFECSECNLRFSRKDNLKLHITRHLVGDCDRPVYKCAHCLKTYTRKPTLHRHIAAFHPETIDDDYPTYKKQRKEFECYHCSSTFGQLDNVRRHIQRVHMEPKPSAKESHFKCLICSNTFRTSKVLNKHYVDVHGVILDYQELKFDCIESYKEWLENHQHQTLTRFTIWYTTKKTDSLFSQRLICHRSRHTRTSLSVDNRKRCLKLSGYKRLGGICPAEIRLYIEKDGSCSVRYQTTHVGHNIGDESELKHMFLTNEEKKKIAAEIQSGTPLAQIIKRKKCSKLSDSGKNFSRLDLVSRTDIRNVATSQKLCLKSGKSPQPSRNLTDVEVKIAEHEADIVFCKRQSEEDSRFNVLREEDFVFVILTANQEKYLRSYGHQVVCLDNIHSSSSPGFFLHMLLVLDADNEALPAAFLLTNRDDQCVVDIFLTCVQDRVGVVEPHTLMTNLQPTYCDSWIKIMNNPSYYLFGSWHVHEAWRKNYGKILNKEKRAEVRAESLRLSCELDPIRFEDGLNSFVSREDDELTDFQHHFQQNYVSNAQRWAYCYRTTTDINYNMAYKSFYMSFKHNLAVGKETQSLNQCLIFIFDYLTSLQAQIIEKNVLCKITNRLSILRNRHRAAFEQYKKDASSRVMVITSDMYMVQSFEKADIFYTITRHESKECDRENGTNVASKPCKLLCDSCNLCFHAFSCTCEDSSIKLNMCKHVHLVGLFLRDQSSESDVGTSQYIIDDRTDVPISYMENEEDSKPRIIELEIHDDIANIEIVDDTSSRKDELIQEMTFHWQEIEDKLTSLDEPQLQRVYNKMKQIEDLAKTLEKG